MPNDFKLAGLDIDFKSLAFNQDGIGLGGRFKLPDNIGGILVDSLSLSPDTVLIRENGVGLGANIKGSLPDFKKGEFALLDLLPVKEISNVSLEYIAAEDKLKLQGKLSVVPFFKQESDATPELVGDLSGDNFIEVKDGKADIKGSLSINNLKFGNVWGLDAKLILDTINNDIGGNAKVSYAFGAGVPVGENTGAGLGFGFKLPLTLPPELNRIGGELDLFNFPIFNTVFYLQEVGVEFNNIAPSDPDPFEFTVSGRVTAGPEAAVLGEKFALFDADASLTSSFERSTLKLEEIKGKGKVKVLKEDIMVGKDIDLTLSLKQGFFEVKGGDWSLLNDAIKAQLGIKATSKFDFKAKGIGSLNIPKSIPLFGGQQIASGNVLLDFSNDGNTSNDFAAGWGTLDIKKLGVEVSIVLGIKGYFDGRFERIGAKNIPETNSFIVEPGTKWLVMGVDWENATSNVPVQIKAPNGTIFNESDFAATGKIAVVDELSDSNTKAVIVLNPEPGVWDINVANPTGLGKVQYTAVRDSIAPTIQVTAPATDITDQNVTINYNAFDADSNAKVSLFYDTDNQGFDGILIADNLAETDGAGSFVWNTEGVATGDYYVYAMVMDENNAPVFSYSPGRVKITESADLSVTKTVNENPDVSGNLTYTLTVTNNGPNDAKGATLTDTLPEGVTLVSANLNPTQQSGNDITFDLGNLANGASKTVNVTITPPPNGTITSIPDVTAKTFDPDVTNDVAFPVNTADNAVINSTDLELSKTVNNTNPNIGDRVTFTLALTNKGPGVASSIKVTDLLPQGLSFVSATPEQGTYDNNTGVWDVGNMRDNLTRTLNIVAKVDTVGSLSTTATVTALSETDPNLANNQASVTLSTIGIGTGFTLVFDENFYLDGYPDVKNAIAPRKFNSGFDQYKRWGITEGREFRVRLFDENYYLAQNSDVAAATGPRQFRSGLHHFNLYGQSEGRKPNSLNESSFRLQFNEGYYLAQNPDVAAAISPRKFKSGFEHFMLYGQFEGRKPSLENNYLSLA